MYCANCGQPVAAGAHFCGSCGRAVEIETQSEPSAAGFANVAAATATAGPGGTTGDHTPLSASQVEGLLGRIRAILFAPKDEWPRISREETSAFGILQRYVVPLAGLVAVVSFVRLSVVGMSLPFGETMRTPIAGGALNAVLTLVMAVIGVCFVAAIVNVLAPAFGGVRQWRQALKASAYSLTPAFIGSLFGLLPAMGTLLGLLSGIYGIYVLYLGLPVVMRSSRDRAGAYTASVVVCTILLGIVFGAIGAAVGIGSGRMLSAMRPTMTREARREQGAATVANIIGGALGTDEKGKAGLASALANVAKAGEQVEAEGQPASGGQSSADDPAAAGRAVNAAGGLLSALGGALGGNHPKQPVDFHKLEGALPANIAGLARTHIEGGSKQALGVKGASAKATYGNGGGTPRIEIEVSDMASVGGLVDLASALPVTETSESDSHYEKDVTIGGRSAHEKFDNASKHGELSVLVAKRFSVDLTGDGLPMNELEKALAHVDIASLESMQNAGAQP